MEDYSFYASDNSSEASSNYDCFEQTVSPTDLRNTDSESSYEEDDSSDENSDNDTKVIRGHRKVFALRHYRNWKRADLFLRNMNADREAGTLTDIVIRVEGVKHLAHKVFIKCQSTYFSENIKEADACSPSQEIEIEGITSEAFKTVLSHMYGCKVILTRTNFENIYVAAERLRQYKLLEKCRRFLIREVYNIELSAAYRVACRFEVHTALNIICEIFIYDNLLKFSEICLLEMPVGLVKTALTWFWNKPVDPSVPDQLYLIACQFIVRWIVHMPLARRGFARELFLIAVQDGRILPHWREQFPIQDIPNTVSTDAELCGNLVTAFKEAIDELHENIAELHLEVVVIYNAGLHMEICYFDFRKWKWNIIKTSSPIDPSKCIFYENSLIIVGKNKEIISFNLLSKDIEPFPDVPFAGRLKASICLFQNHIFWIGDDNSTGLGEPFELGHALNLTEKIWKRKRTTRPTDISLRKTPALASTKNGILVFGGSISGNESVICKDGYFYEPLFNRTKKVGELEKYQNGPVQLVILSDNSLHVFPQNDALTKEVLFVEAFNLKYKYEHVSYSFHNPIYPAKPGLKSSVCAKGKDVLLLTVPTDKNENILLLKLSGLYNKVSCLTDLPDCRPSGHKLKNNLEYVLGFRTEKK